MHFPGTTLRPTALEPQVWVGAGNCYFFFHSIVSDSLRPHRLYSSWNSPGQNTGVGSLSLLQGIFPNQGSNPGLPHCRQILYQLNHKGSPRILEWVEEGTYIDEVGQVGTVCPNHWGIHFPVSDGVVHSGWVIQHC